MTISKIFRNLINKIKFKFRAKKLKSYNISCGYEYHDTLTGGDITPGDVPVVSSQTWHLNIYQGYFDKDAQWVVCSLEEKFWWIIPFTYDKFIFELPKIKFDLRKGDFTTKEVCNFVYQYARDTRDYQTIETDGVTAFLVNSKPVQLYDTSKNEYMFRRLTGNYLDKQ